MKEIFPDIIIKEKRKSFTMTVDYEAKVILKVPKNSSAKAIEHFIAAHQKWLAKNLALKEALKQEFGSFYEYRKLLILGKVYEIRPDEIKKSIRLSDYLCVPSKYYENGMLSQMGIAALGRWLKRKAEEYFNKRLSEYALKYGFEFNGLKLINGRTRWGCCNSKKIISLNYRAVMLDVEIGDYIMVHELAHLKELNHSPKFWAVVAQILPDYTKKRNALKNSNWMQKLFRV